MEKEQKIPYRAIALDLDGTLTNHEKVVTPRTRQALLKAQDNGGIIILASGRPTYGIQPVAECLELEKRGGFILSYNGGKIVDAKTGEEYFSQYLPDSVIPLLYQFHGSVTIKMKGLCSGRSRVKGRRICELYRMRYN